MKNVTRVHGKLTITKRLNNSVSGNPRFLINVDGYSVKTTVDSSLGYSVQNFDGKDVIATVGTHYGVLSLADVYAAQ
jgi:hypothetical protein